AQRPAIGEGLRERPQCRRPTRVVRTVVSGIATSYPAVTSRPATGMPSDHSALCGSHPAYRRRHVAAPCQSGVVDKNVGILNLDQRFVAHKTWVLFGRVDRHAVVREVKKARPVEVEELHEPQGVRWPEPLNRVVPVRM